MTIITPVVTEKATRLMEQNNSLTFIVDIDSTKPEIRDEIELMYDVKVENVNTMITAKGKKKAVIDLASDYDAEEIAGRIGIF
ncbi:50S ribosomal protein L23 [Methanonatronarchaeum sp. AMET6-2]|uniref:50S ribosomal protein L23 n=1 Tax=Methanonatronarchaeum sp. AMET6-2 TaxID=2933293 RepID=UPI00120D9950|nr:50S ribosomal protein L23 [Methanonatronarchaeum sp. AMET6-2]RZN60209.1 MAG: 50S ribosomal protein L23 [Methanonatronarchaeia archaeon]UOY10703.1 50S ribosomal protein L23 [Methanonatronarchaeum sp. AMET6-2]